MKDLTNGLGFAAPVIYLLTILIGGMVASDYSHVGQHVSELAVNESARAKIVFDVGITLTALSILMFCIGIWLRFGSRFALSVALLALFGVTFVFGVLFPIGSPWHGGYGVGFAVVMLPLLFLYELGRENAPPWLRWLSGVVTLVLLGYFWLILAQFYPVEQRGLAQRVFGAALFVYIAAIALVLRQESKG